MAATMGLPVYMCGGGTIPLRMEWLADGMGSGGLYDYRPGNEDYGSWRDEDRAGVEAVGSLHPVLHGTEMVVDLLLNSCKTDSRISVPYVTRLFVSKSRRKKLLTRCQK